MTLLIGYHKPSREVQVELTGISSILEERLKPITAEMNVHPLRVNRATWQTKLAEAEESADLLITYCQHLTNDDRFRPNSTADCARALFTDQGRLPLEFTETKQVSTSKDVLTTLSNDGDELAEAIVLARSAISCRSQLRAWAPYAQLGCVQPVWDSLGSPHARYTSEKPSLNNRIPQIRMTIEPDEGFSFLGTDLSQCEFVTWASLSGDPAFKDALLGGEDFHAGTAAAIKKLVPGWNIGDQDQRSAGKTVGFAILYQMREYTLASKLGCSLAIATRIIKAYYDRFPVAARHIGETLDEAKRNGYVETAFGRKRYCPEYASGDCLDVHETEKTLWHFHNSGTAAEYLKLKQVAAWEAIRRAGIKSDEVRLSAQLYDGLLWQVRDKHLEQVSTILEECMSKPVRGFLPFRTETKIGKTWEATE